MDRKDGQLTEEELDAIEKNIIEDNVSAIDHILLILSSFGLFAIGTIWYLFFY